MNTLNEKTLIMNYIDPDVQAGFRKGRENRDQIAKICWIIKKQHSSGKTFTSALSTTSQFDHNKLWKILQEMEYQTTLPAS